jgi:pseudouridine synthase
MTVPRLQKLLAERGVASRRAAADLIRAGKVRVDGEPVREPGLRVDPDRSVVTIEGRPLPGVERRRTILLHKPRGYVCSRVGQSSRSIYELLAGVPERVVPAGRLDKDSEGLLVLSNDGDLVNRLTHPRHGQVKVYRATVSGSLDGRVLDRLNGRLVIDGYRIQPAAVTRVRLGQKAGRAILEFRLAEGRNRQVRKMCAAVGLRVHRLVRTASGPLSLRGLSPGEWRDVTPAELKELEGNPSPV